MTTQFTPPGAELFGVRSKRCVPLKRLSCAWGSSRRPFWDHLGKSMQREKVALLTVTLVIVAYCCSVEQKLLIVAGGAASIAARWAMKRRLRSIVVVVVFQRLKSAYYLSLAVEGSHGAGTAP